MFLMKLHAAVLFCLFSGSLPAGIEPGHLVPSVTCEAVELGFADADRLRADENLEALRDDPRFAGLLARLESR